jgi:ankyrin repeat protein
MPPAVFGHKTLVQSPPLFKLSPVRWIAGLANQVKELRARDWKRLKELRRQQRNPHPLAVALASDDVLGFQEIFAHMGFDLTLRIPPCIFDNVGELSLLSYAAQYNAIHCVRFLILNGARVDESEMHQAIVSGNSEIVRLFDDKYKFDTPATDDDQNRFVLPYAAAPRTVWGGADPANRTWNYDGLLLSSLEHHRNEVFHWLLDAKYKEHDSLLQILVQALGIIFQSNNFDGLMTVIDMGVDLGASSRNGHWGPSSFNVVIRNGFFDMLRLIDTFAHDQLVNALKSGKTPARYGFGFGLTQTQVPCPLADAATVGSLAILEFILQTVGVLEPADVCQAIGAAFKSGFVDAAEWLIERVDPNILRKSIAGILMDGCGTGGIEIAALLLPFVGQTDLSTVAEAAACHQNFALVQFMVSHQLNISLERILTSAIRSGNLEIPLFIQSLNADLHLENLEDTLTAAIKIGHLQGVQFLFETLTESDREIMAIRLIPIAIQSNECEVTSFLMSFSPTSSNSLIVAVQLGSHELVKALLDRDSSPRFVNQLSNSGEGSSLCIAAASGNLAIVQTLMQVPGIDVKLYNQFHETPLIIASNFKHLAIMRALMDFMCDDLAKDRVQINTAFLAAFRPINHRPVNSQADGPRVYPNLSRFLGSERDPEPTSFALDPRFADLTFEMIPLFMSFPTIDVNFYHLGETILLVAARTRNYPLMRELLKVTAVNSNVYDRGGNTVLMYCAEYGNLEGIKLLTKETRTNLNCRNFQQATAFSIAASRSHKEIVQYLVKCPGFDPEKSNAQLALILASPERDDIIQLILALDFDINKSVCKWSFRSDRQRQITPLTSAVQRNAPTLIRQIITHRRFDAMKSSVDHAMFAAVKLMNVTIFQSLLPLVHHDVNFRNSSNESLLTYACLLSDVPIVRTILSSPTFDPSKQDPVHALGAAIRADVGPLIPILMQVPGVDINAPLPPGINGLRVRGIAMNGGSVPPDESDDEGDSNSFAELPAGVPPLIAAARLDRSDVTTILLTTPGVDLNVRGEFGQTILCELLHDSTRLFHFIDTEGIDINATDFDGETALFYAILQHEPTIIAALVRKGIDLNIRNVHGVLFSFNKPLGNLCMPQPEVSSPRSRRTARSTSRR